MDDVVLYEDVVDAAPLPGPVYPRWMSNPDGTPRIPPKPSPSFCETLVKKEASEYANLRNRFRRDVDLVRQAINGIFPGYDPSHDILFTSAELRNQVTTIAGMIAGIEPLYEVPYRTIDEQNASTRVERWAAWFIRSLREMHRGSGNSDLFWDAAWYGLVYGRIVARIMLDPEDEEFPWDITLVDPSTIVPSWGGKHGLHHVTLLYRERLGTLLDTYDPTGKRKLAAKFGAQLRRSAIERGDPFEGLDLSHEVEVMEYCDRWWRYISADGIVVLPVTAHEYGFCPYRVWLSQGEPATATIPERPVTQAEANRGIIGNSSKQTDIIYKGVPFFESAKRTHEQLEASMGLLFKGLMKAIDPPINTTTPYNSPPEQWSNNPGDENFSRPGEQRQPVVTSPSPIDLQPLLGKLREDIVKAGLPDHLYGMSNESNVSGFAVESLIAAAKHKIQPYIDLQETFLGDLLSCSLKLFQNWGHLVVPDGVLRMPLDVRRGPALMTDPPEMVLDRPTIDLVGTHVKVRLHSTGLQNMTAMANVANMLVQAKLWSRTRGNEFLGEPDPQLLFEQVLAEDAMTDPDMLKMVTYPKALEATGNWEGLVAYMMTVVLPAILGPGNAGPPTAGPGGMTSIPSNPETTQGASQPAVGQGPGPGSGPGNGGSAPPATP